MSVILAQRGARHRYLIPEIINDAGLLECLYTDSHSRSVLGRVMSVVSKFGVRSPQTDRLLKRVIPLPADRIKSSDRLFLKQMQCVVQNRPLEEMVSVNYEYQNRLFKKWGTGKADCLYTMFIDNVEFVEWAKERGLHIIADIYENPYIFGELINEISDTPEYTPVKYLIRQYEVYKLYRDKYLDRILSVADDYVVPSEYVRDCIKRSPAFSEGKVNIIPYPSSITTRENENRPVKGRIIWVGNDAVRKGIVYCQRAAKELHKYDPSIDFRIIGSVEPEIMRSPDFSDLNFLGKLTKEQLADELRVADMYVFPTLAEGFAGTVIEAASFGVPIITTVNSGCANDFPAIFVAEKQHETIVEAVVRLLENRDMRQEYSQATFEYARQLSPSSFANNLLTLLNNVENNK